MLRDFFGTGVINTTMDVPQQGMKVDVTDPAGHHVTGITDATGKFVVSPSTVLTGGQYRVDVTVPAPYSNYLRAALRLRPQRTTSTASPRSWTCRAARTPP
ncbi:hypothetical protein [Saccharopolyspora spinosa]|uniref:hypothetical protein n=1 Tax=Saccharopolyspora spinosa TaxID=60894 RepID=UPI003747E277